MLDWWVLHNRRSAVHPSKKYVQLCSRRFVSGSGRGFVSVKKKDIYIKVEMNTAEENIKELAGAKRTMSAMFVATGGNALNTNIAFCAGALVLLQEKKVNEKKEHKQKAEAYKRQEDAKKVLNETVGKDNSKMTVSQLGILVKWKMNGEGHSKITGRTARLKKWLELKNVDIPNVDDPGSVSDEEVVIPSMDDAIAEMKKEYLLAEASKDVIVCQLAQLGKDRLERAFVKAKALQDLPTTIKDVKIPSVGLLKDKGIGIGVAL